MRHDDFSADRDAQLEKLEIELGRAHTRIAEQSARIAALARGREESMRLLDDARAELGRVAAERNRLQQRLVAVEDMQTQTVALPENDAADTGSQAELPNVDELMVSLNAMLEDSDAPVQRRRLAVEQPDAEWHEMIAAEVIAPNVFDDGLQPGAAAPSLPTPRFLVFMNADHPISYPLHKDVMTIGRSESADIKIFGEFVSRIHARIVCREDGVMIEDAGSKNGFKINSKDVERHELQHGDVVTIGKLHLTFVDPGAQD